MPLISIKNRGDLDAQLTLAPERYVAHSADSSAAGLLDVARLAATYIRPADAGPFVALDTTHALDGFIASRALQPVYSVQSTKKRLEAGDVIVSRLRPYLRQIAYVDQTLCDRYEGAILCCSTEFYVLRPLNTRSIAFLIPFLLTVPTQERLARSQEGGHHPRVPAATIAALRIPQRLVEQRDERSAEFLAVIAAYRQAEQARDALIGRAEEDADAAFVDRLKPSALAAGDCAGTSTRAAKGRPSPDASGRLDR